MCTCSDGMTKQSPSPQHHSPAAFLCAPREIQLSWADTSGAKATIENSSSSRALVAMAVPFVVVPAAALVRRRYVSFRCSQRSRASSKASPKSPARVGPTRVVWNYEMILMRRNMQYCNAIPQYRSGAAATLDYEVFAVV